MLSVLIVSAPEAPLLHQHRCSGGCMPRTVLADDAAMVKAPHALLLLRSSRLSCFNHGWTDDFSSSLLRVHTMQAMGQQSRSTSGTRMLMRLPTYCSSCAMWRLGGSASSTSRPCTRWCPRFRASGTRPPRTKALSCDQRRRRLLLAPLPPLQVKPQPLLLPLLPLLWHDETRGDSAISLSCSQGALVFLAKAS